MWAHIVYQRYNRRNLAILLSMTILIAMMLMFVIAEYINKLTGYPIADTVIGYDVGYVQTIFRIIADNNSAIVYYILVCMDTIFPFLYATSAALFMVPIQIALFRTDSKMNNLVFLPYLAMILDYIENTLLLSQFIVYPTLDSGIITVASMFTTAKWVLLTVTFVVITVEMIAYLYFWSKEKKYFNSS